MMEKRNLGLGRVDVWIFQIGDWRERRFEMLTHILSVAEQERASRFQVEDDRWRFVIGRAGLRRAFAQLTSTSVPITIAESPNGKPYVPGGLPFSISHSGQYVAVSIAETPVGIDIEQLRALEDLELLAEHVMSRNDLRVLEISLTKEKDFYQNWTIKEALLKGTGVGIRANLRNFEVGFGPEGSLCIEQEHKSPVRWFWTTLTMPKGYVGAVATKDVIPLVQRHSSQRLFD